MGVSWYNRKSSSAELEIAGNSGLVCANLPKSLTGFFTKDLSFLKNSVLFKSDLIYLTIKPVLNF